MPSLRIVLVLWCCVLCSAPVAWSSVIDNNWKDNHADPSEDLETTLEDEMDNQENILTQLLGDYDKVKTLSEGPDCHCKCVVKPLSRSACKRIEEGSAKAEDFYTVETVTSGSNCKKCACVAPPSALNPCEGDFRFKKLQEAGKDDIKLSTIMDLLEGAFYGMDLLKLHSVTTKLLERVEIIEKSVSGNLTKERVSLKGVSGEKIKGKGSRANHRMEKKKRLSDVQPSLQKNMAAAYTHTEKKYEERFVGTQSSSRPLLKRSHSEGQEVAEGPQKAKSGSNGLVIRGVTYYKSNTEENGEEELAGADEALSGDGSVDLLIDDQLPKQSPKTTRATAFLTTAAPSTPTLSKESSEPTRAEEQVDQNVATTADMVVVTNQITEENQSTIKTLMPSTTQARVMTTTTTAQPAATNGVAISTPPPTEPKQPLNLTAPPSQETSQSKVKSRLNWDEDTTEAVTGAPKNSGVCKDTLATIGDPVTHNTYGRNEGAWMKDPKGNGNIIYVTNYYYGNILLEFRDMDTFKQGRSSNSYKLPYNWIGTGHVIYGGAFYYNRAFSRDIIKFDLRLRYVAAWTILHDAVLEEDTLGHSDIDFAVDESGLWMIYPALDEEGFHQEVIILSKLNPSDLQKENSWRTGLRRHYYGNSFVICGVLYAVDNSDRTHANISYAFDTHTHTQMIPLLPFTNNYTYTTQIDYNPKDRMLYAWDNGHQVTYDVIFAY
ncbi:olfactomedin-like protein 2B [Chanos chanos]|uniref:Olfactomedin-like protein 2B n=1 Tax=Chanos chanos TaxID=29144 RepID=A0A6J2VH07_CHACN|nr:olfactomedin-like protein 2B [Chanos chanos]